MRVVGQTERTRLLLINLKTNIRGIKIMIISINKRGTQLFYLQVEY